jgi:hypothetical protein
VAEEEGGKTVAGWNRGSGREAATATPQSQDGMRRRLRGGRGLFVNLDSARVSFWFGVLFAPKDFKALQFLEWTNGMRLDVLLLITGHVRLSYNPYFSAYFFRRNSVFSHNKSTNSNFSHDFSTKRMGQGKFQVTLALWV